MISVKEAKNFIDQNACALSPVELPLREAAGLTLAEDIYANFNIPSFEQSSMDGYALRYLDSTKDEELLIQDEIPAGRTDNVQLSINKAIRIFTGAPLPVGADTVVMQEKTSVKGDVLKIQDPHLLKGTNVRPIGSEILKGTLALTKGTKLIPAAVGFLATIGQSKASVYNTPKVTIIVTGKEIRQPGTTLQHGQVYECNSFALHAALQNLHIKEICIEHADDDMLIIQQLITKHLLTSDMVLITGGVSVGDYDFVTQALKECGVDKIFHSIKQRPGRPLYFGRKENKLVFGLPGNPSSVLTCFYEYVVPALEKMMQMANSSIIIKRLPLASDYSKKIPFTFFLKGYFTNDNVMLLDAQESYKLQSFAKANCLVCLPEERNEFKEDEMVEVHILPF